jgi:hypothetical protein
MGLCVCGGGRRRKKERTHPTRADDAFVVARQTPKDLLGPFVHTSVISPSAS